MAGMCAAHGADMGAWLQQFKFFNSFACMYIPSVSLPLFSMIVFGGIALYQYARQNHVIIPLILSLLTGGVVLNEVAGPAITLATIVILVGGSGLMTYLYARHSSAF